jgi:RNA polymerase sigma-70 factor, ECF subfamily
MVPADPPDHTLVRRAQQHDPDAVSELYRRYAGQIYRFCRFRVADEASAQDLTGDIFLNMVEALPRYVIRDTPFAAWLYRLAHDRVVDHYRRLGRRPTADLSESLPDGTPGPEVLAIQHASAERLRAAMTQLSDDYRLVLQLRFMEGYDLAQTAQTMCKSVGATKVLQHRALRRLAQLLGT